MFSLSIDGGIYGLIDTPVTFGHKGFGAYASQSKFHGYVADGSDHGEILSTNGADNLWVLRARVPRAND